VTWSFRTPEGDEVATFDGDPSDMTAACDAVAELLGCPLTATPVPDEEAEPDPPT
jgi:hypothetical protein